MFSWPVEINFKMALVFLLLLLSYITFYACIDCVKYEKFTSYARFAVGDHISLSKRMRVWKAG